MGSAGELADYSSELSKPPACVDLSGDLLRRCIIVS